MTSRESFDVVLRRAPEGDGARVLEDVLGLSSTEAHDAVKTLPAAVIRGTTRAHGEIASGLLREAGWAVELVVHGSPLAAPKSKRRAPREISETRGRHRDLSAPLTARRLVPVQPSDASSPALAGSAALDMPVAAPVEVELASEEPPTPAVVPPPAEANIVLPARVEDPDSAFGPLDLESGLFHKSSGREEPPRRVTAEDAIEALFQPPSAAAAAQGLAHVEREARARLENDEAKSKPTKPKARGVVLPVMVSVGRPSRFKRFVSALATLGAAYVGVAWYRDSAATDRLIAAREQAGTGPSAAEIRAIHPAIRLAPRGLQKPMGVILRRLVDGLVPVSIDTEGMPDDTQCLLVKAGDGKLAQRLAQLKRTGMTLRLDEARAQEMQEHIESLRAAWSDPALLVEPLCLSVAQYQELTTAPE